jgi:competence ComEA-like helix-hairpin-helix protein
MDANNGAKNQAGKGDSLSQALSAYRDLTSRFGGGANTSNASETDIEVPLDEIIKLIPERYLDKSRAGKSSGTIFIAIPNLLDQLQHGKVTISMQDLVAHVPAAMLLSQAFDDRTVISLPLSMIVSALDPALLQKPDSMKKEREYNIGNLPDPFRRGEAPAGEAPPMEEMIVPPAPRSAQPEEQKPVVAMTEKPTPVVPEKPAETPEAVELEEQEPAPAPVPEPVASPPQIGKQELKPARQKAAPSASGEAPEPALIEETGPPGGVNINTAETDQLISVEGLSPAIAKRIIEYRNAKGPFKDIFELCDVPGLGKNTFKMATGMPYNAKRQHRARKLARLLLIPPSKTCHIPTIAQALAGKPGFTGCVVSDKDGFVVAASNVGALAEAIGPIAHEIFTEMRKSMEIAGAKEVDSVSISVQGQMFTIARTGDIYLTAVHDSNRITASTLKLIYSIAEELTWALSRRVYLGK